jgi:hypothetical protein
MVVVCKEEEEVSGGEERGRKYLPLFPSRCCPDTPTGSTAGGSAVVPLSLSHFAQTRASGSTGACPAVVPLARSLLPVAQANLLRHVAPADWMSSPVVPVRATGSTAGHRWYRFGSRCKPAKETQKAESKGRSSGTYRYLYR